MTTNETSSIHRRPAASVRVEIQQQEDGLTAVITPERILIEPGVPVRWRFTSVPPNHQPLLHFTEPTDAAAAFDTGPFELLCQRDNQILGLGSRVEEGRYPYEVLLLPMGKKRPPWCLGTGTIRIILPPPDDDVVTPP